jgi:hypothetical protein
MRLRVRLALLVLHLLPVPRALCGATGIAVRAGQIVTGAMIAIVKVATVVLVIAAGRIGVVRRGLLRAGSRLIMLRRVIRHGDAMATGVTRVAEIAATIGHGGIGIVTTNAVPR